MPRENAQAKGRRYLAEGRLTLRQVDGEAVRTICKGEGTVYHLGWTLAEGWTCSCPALTRCAHLYALGLVVVVPGGAR